MPSAMLSLGFDDTDPASMTVSRSGMNIPSDHTLHIDGMVRKPSPIIQAVCSKPATGSYKLLSLPTCTTGQCGTRFQTSFLMRITLPPTTITTAVKPQTVVLLFKYAQLSIYAALDKNIIGRGVIQASILINDDPAFCSFETRLPLDAWFHLLVDRGRQTGMFLVFVNGLSAEHQIEEPCADIDFTGYPDPAEARLGDSGVEVCVDQLSYNEELGDYYLRNPVEVAAQQFYTGIVYKLRLWCNYHIIFVSIIVIVIIIMFIKFLF